MRKSEDNFMELLFLKSVVVNWTFYLLMNLLDTYQWSILESIRMEILKKCWWIRLEWTQSETSTFEHVFSFTIPINWLYSCKGVSCDQGKRRNIINQTK